MIDEINIEKESQRAHNIRINTIWARYGAFALALIMGTVVTCEVAGTPSDYLKGFYRGQAESLEKCVELTSK